MSPFKSLIKSHCGLLFEGAGERILRIALEARIAAARYDPGEYLQRLQADEGELRELVSRLTINETYFFREPEQIQLVVARLLPRIMTSRPPGRPIRILSAGCASGEEPYSIVMALRERYGQGAGRLFRVTGCDIDREVLAKAREGLFHPFSFRGVAAEVRERHFDPAEGGTYRVKDEIRRAVEFFPLNLLDEQFPAALEGQDLILFRNVSIYFDEPTRRAILRRLAGLLAEEGYLILGSSETLANDLGILPLVEDGGSFYFVKRPAVSPIVRDPPTGNPSSLPLSPSVTVRSNSSPGDGCGNSPAPTCGSGFQPRLGAQTPQSRLQAAPTGLLSLEAAHQGDFATAFALALEKRHDEAQALCRRLSDVFPTDPRPLLLCGYLLAQRRHWAEARAVAQRALELEEWSLDALFLLGWIAHREGDGAAALRWLKQAIYHRPDCWPAHFYRAERLRAEGEPEQARRSYRSVLQLLAKGNPAGGITAFPLALPLGELRLLCERHAGGPSAALRTPAR